MYWILKKMSWQLQFVLEHMMLQKLFYMNSNPSYFRFDMCESSSKTTPLMVNAVMYVEVFPFSSSVRSATMISSLDVGINLNDEKPLVAAEFAI